MPEPRIKEFEREGKVREIAKATIKPVPPIKEALVAVRKSDGMEYSPHGSIPWESSIEKRGYCYSDPKTGTIYGRRYPTEEAAERSWKYREARNAVAFMRDLRGMDDKDFKAQADYWLKQYRREAKPDIFDSDNPERVGSSDLKDTWNIAGIAEGIVKAIKEDPMFCEDVDPWEVVFDEVCADDYWSIYSRDPENASAVMALVKDHIASNGLMDEGIRI
jgi:hypothetical protein